MCHVAATQVKVHNNRSSGLLGAPWSGEGGVKKKKMMQCSRLGLSRMTASMARALVRTKHTLPSLPYGYKELEPVISGEIMELHHSKHHATYVNNLNTAEDQLKECVERGMSTGMLFVY